MARCQRVTESGTCYREAENGSRYCRPCQRKGDVVQYRLNDPDLQETVTHHARGAIIDLSQQVILLRGMIERRLNMANSKAEKITAYNFVTQQLATLTKMTESLVKLQRESGELMERSEVEAFVDRVIQVVSEELQGIDGFEEIVDRIVSRLEPNENE